MNHPAELAINQYLEDATSGKSTMSEETIKQIGADVMTGPLSAIEALLKHPLTDIGLAKFLEDFNKTNK